MRILVVDDNPDFRLVIAEYLAEGATQEIERTGTAGPDTVIEAKPWDPQRGVPDAQFDWARIQAIVINYEPGATSVGSNAFVWLAQTKKASGKALEELPPVVMLTGRDTGDIVMRATRLGIADCLPRISLSPTRLYAMVRSVIDERQAVKTMEKAMKTGIMPAFTPVDPATVGAPIAPSEKPAFGMVRGYRVIRKIGTGGTAQVYLARRDGDAKDAPPVVLKVMDKELSRDTRFLERFMQEFSMIQKIKSEYVTRIFDLGYDEGVAYLVMEYFGAGDLRDRIKAGIAPVQALKILAQVSQALAAVHDAGIVHRDLKPHNIMFRDPHLLAIVDFGGAKNLDEDYQFTNVGHVVGTPMYMSPEQVLGRPLTGSSDLYALGVIFHLMLTGRPLYIANSAAEMMDLHINAPIPLLPDSLSGFQPILERLVAKKAEDRFTSAHEIYQQLMV